MSSKNLYSMKTNNGIMKFYLPRVYKRGPPPTMILDPKIKKLVDISNCKDSDKIPTFVLTELYIKNKFSQQKVANLFGVQQQTIHRWLKRLNIHSRSQGDSVSLALSKHVKSPFSENLKEKAYLLGMRCGDISTQKHGRNIRVHTGSTHPEMLKLFRQLFSKYGNVRKYPKVNKDKKLYSWSYSWKIYCDVDKSFKFLLKKPEKIPKWIMNNDKLFYSFLSGYFDAEGCISVSYKYGCGSNVQWIISTGDKYILKDIYGFLKQRNFTIYMKLYKKTDNIKYKRDIWRVQMGIKPQIFELIKLMSIKHREKVDKINLTIGFMENNWENASERIIEFRQNIKKDVRECVKSAEKEFMRRKNYII